MDRKQTLELKEIIKRISEFHCVSAIFLFGSRANKKARQDSDIDIAVLTKNSKNEEELDIIGLGNNNFDVSIFSRLPLIIQFRILKKGKILFCKDYKDIYDTKVKVFRYYLDYLAFINKFYRRVLSDV